MEEVSNYFLIENKPYQPSPNELPKGQDSLITDSFCVSGALWPEYNGIYIAQQTVQNSRFWYKNQNSKCIYMRASQDRWYFDDDMSSDNGVWGFLSSAIGETPIQSRVSDVPSMWFNRKWVANPEMKIRSDDCEKIKQFSSFFMSRLTVFAGAAVLALLILLIIIICTQLILWCARYNHKRKEQSASKNIQAELDLDSSNYNRNIFENDDPRRPSLPAIPNPFGRSNTFRRSSQSSLCMIGEEISEEDSELDDWNLEAPSDEDAGIDRFGNKNRSLSVSFIYDMNIEDDDSTLLNFAARSSK